ncbi:hypothetical protein [Campylobacter mucosalis]|uniref:Uncharacterized protein n=1 Tax=Campylobacter mucosalis CCUG 21559 TaxID=1032067 RepID=A0A6G5QHA3_9BACT|nr:hypothetical protein [Campylobacter mucosalis]QCD45012.1 hypothetical protein CMUC_1247 [Campylobacter mucosalis CCUG 21559]
MINAISKVQKVATNQAKTIHLNTSLPVSILVSEKVGFNRYILKFANQSISTRSVKSLNVGQNYWGEIENSAQNIVISNLLEKPKFDSFVLNDGLSLIERLINEPNTAWFSNYLKNALINSNSKHEFGGFSNMLLALSKGIIYIPFIYNENFGIFELKNGIKSSKIYLVFSNFAPLLFTFNASNLINIKTPFKKVASLLSAEFNLNVEISNVLPLLDKNENLIDFKG